ncbi:hypothetical protein [Ammoniphilus resinae]|uniref:Uncharacterized protein n=1 Tax=Ammoniphilus resinae TaxID=861532 RepID=A0ABS4GSS3_9BACL|nr:hypothetical protein [Ammoniphilus resinae]MBP1933299.1 hypothetical protein [Ammoniphilus resinae]
MEKTRQQILILHLENPDLQSKTVAWALYDGATPVGQRQMSPGDSDTPPYTSVLDAMRDGWNVIQVAQLPYLVHGHEYDTGILPFEYIMERKVQIHDEVR